MNGNPFALPNLRTLAALCDSLTGPQAGPAECFAAFLRRGCQSRRRNRIAGNDQLVVPGVGRGEVPARIFVGHIRETRQAIVIVPRVIVFQHKLLHFDPLPKRLSHEVFLDFAAVLKNDALTV